MNWAVYIITNEINGKVYIGITNERFKDIYDRLEDHIQLTRDGGKYTSSGRKYALHAAIEKYGETNFNIDYLERDLSLEEAQTLETHYIIEYESLANGINSNGYNLSYGGEEPDYDPDYV